MAFKIFLSPPNMGGKELEYVKEAFETNWIAPYGPSLDKFEDEMEQFTGVAHALAVSSGTAAMHLIFRWLGITEDNLVFCSDLTFIGSCTPICYERATPVFIDSEPDSWNMSPKALEKAFEWAKSQGKLPKAVIIVDLYGESADWDALLPICRKYNVPVIEDAAEAVGSLYKGKKCGSFGNYSVFSFNGNKIMTTSGGGMVLSHNELAIAKMRFWSTQAREPQIHYEHKEYGYNYRMSNICAAIGRGQLEFLQKKISLRKAIHKKYSEKILNIPAHIKTHNPVNDSNCWLNLLYIDSDTVTPNDIIAKLQNAGIEARPAWKPMHLQPLFDGAVFFAHFEDGESVGEQVFLKALCLPSGGGLTDKVINGIVNEIESCF